MNVGTITSKGQITIPAAIREMAGLVPGTRVEFVVSVEGAIYLLPLTATAETFFNALQGFERTDFSGNDEEALAEAFRENEPPGAAVNPDPAKDGKSRGARSKIRGKAA